MPGKTASFLINPRAGENAAKLSDILAVLSAGGYKTEIALKEYGKHIMVLAREATLEKKSDLVIVYGGDGTLNQAVNGVMSVKGKRPTVGLIPGGTANVWAGEIGVPTDPVKAALTLINSETRNVDVGRISVRSISFPGDDKPSIVPAKAGKKASQESGKVRHHFLLMAGIGLDAAIMSGVSKPLKYQIGPFAVGLSAAKELPEQHPFPVEIQAGQDSDSLWRGEAVQIVLGNTRRYAKVERITPDAYVDDGAIDVCVITAGNPLTTLQQLSSLLLRQKPDNTTAEYFKGSHLRIKVPASAPLQVDGSAVKLKDYLSSSDYEKLAHLNKEELDKIFITYQIDTLPQALPVAIPLAYDEELFEHAYHPSNKENGAYHEQEESETGQRLKHGLFQRHRHEDGKPMETSSQKHTTAVETLAESELHSKDDKSEQEQEHVKELSKELPDVMDALASQGRKVAIFGKAPCASRPNTYVIAGAVQKRSGEAEPGAVVVTEKTTIFDHEGRRVSNLEAAMRELAEGAVVIVDGKCSKRNVVQARRLVLP
ncbi:diacylglycerol/lipid kinase family protein [Dictyobacter formicarum]|uniref:DAGKc domain-containing protein n=1 Tax=Dictyobacter formicarum TaxID=2778368 RepID=A0ABQ3VGG9_9CHLR|nr:YegS/Rv2252/BmrU family lipid kinase [Dictyobacter formicarum]GHO85027.1 hypothetical protein KSZ_30330 [Dictyobacter formicarum]